MYFLLLSRKERQPSVEDEARAPGDADQKGKEDTRRLLTRIIIISLLDPPRKRIDSKCASPQLQLQRARLV